MFNEVAEILTNPLHQALLGIPLSVIGNLTTDTIKVIWENLNRKGRIERLEDLLFSSFLKALDMHGHRYDAAARQVTNNLKSLVAPRKQEFLDVLKTTARGDHLLPPFLDDVEIQNYFVSAFTVVFKDSATEKSQELVQDIVRDACIFYRDTFFEDISQEQQLWIVFKESLKIDSICEVLYNLQENLPTREQFESIRTYILARELTPEKIDVQKHKYLSYLERKFATVEIKGVSPRVQGQDISFDLDDIFIPFKIKNDRKAESCTTIHNSYNKYYNLFKDTEPLRTEKASLLERLEKSPCIVLLGDPGSGKSTLLKYIAKQVCKFHELNELLPFYIPIFVRVSEYARALKSNPGKRLLEYLYHDFDSQYTELFQWAFQNYRALLLLDGLDEVLDTSQRIRVVDELEDIVARNPQNRYIITSRIVGYNEARLGKNFSQFTLQPFGRKEIEAFCKSWYKAVAKNASQDLSSAFNEAAKLNKAIVQKAEIEKLASNPLMITLIASIHFKGQTLPYNRVELYDVAIETLLQYWAQNRVDEERQLKDRQDVIDILSPIAFHIHKYRPEGIIEESEFDNQCKSLLQGDEYGFTAQESKIEIKELKKFLREQTGFFHEKGVNEVSNERLFGFLHQTFQEYLAAIEVVNQWKEEIIDFSELLLNPRWSEVIRLASGILKSEKGRAGKRSLTRFVENILSYNNKHNEIHPRGILLVSLILSDNIDLVPQSQDIYFDVFFKSWSQEIDNKLLDDFAKRFTLLVQSKHKDAVWQKMRSILDITDHPLHKRFAPVLAQNSYILPDAKKYFAQFLQKNDRQVSETFWNYLKQHVSNASQGLYYDSSNYGYPGYSNYDPIIDVESLIGYSEFLRIIEFLSAECFSQLFNTIQNILSNYIYVYNTGWGNAWYTFDLPEDLIFELEKNNSSRIRALILSILEKNTQVSNFKEQIQEAIKDTHNADDLFIYYKEKLRVKFNESLKS